MILLGKDGPEPQHPEAQGTELESGELRALEADSRRYERDAKRITKVIGAMSTLGLSATVTGGFLLGALESIAYIGMPAFLLTVIVGSGIGIAKNNKTAVDAEIEFHRSAKDRARIVARAQSMAQRRLELLSSAEDQQNSRTQ